MDKTRFTITLIYGGKEYVINTYKNQYFSLMSLISENIGSWGFGICSGMGSCGTCMVNIFEKESTFKRRVISCQVQVDNDLDNMMVEVPE